MPDLTIDELVRAECGSEHYSNRRVLTLRVLAALSDPDVRSSDARVRMAALVNEDDHLRLVHTEWRGRRGPRFQRVLSRAKYELVADLTIEELRAFHVEVLRELACALPMEM